MFGNINISQEIQHVAIHCPVSSVRFQQSLPRRYAKFRSPLGNYSMLRKPSHRSILRKSKSHGNHSGNLTHAKRLQNAQFADAYGTAGKVAPTKYLIAGMVVSSHASRSVCIISAERSTFRLDRAPELAPSEQGIPRNALFQLK